MTDVQNHATTATSSGDHEAWGSPPLGRLNHAEFLHWPGESGLVLELFEALNCRVEIDDTSQFGRYLICRMAGTPGVNDFFVSEAEAEVLALEAALRSQIETRGSDLGVAYQQFRRMLEQRPYRATHLGIRLPSIGIFDEVVARIESLINGKFAGRLSLGYAMTRTAEEAGNRRPLKQVWVWTDVISTGLLTTGQQIEIQTYNP
jgi:hypothetical protein